MPTTQHVSQVAHVARNFYGWIAGETAKQSWQALTGRPPPRRSRPAPETLRYKQSIRAPWPQPNPHAP